MSAKFAVHVARMARRGWDAVRQPTRRAVFVAAAVAIMGGSPVALIEGAHGTAKRSQPPPTVADAGIRFDCGGDRSGLTLVRAQMRAYLERTGIAPSWVGERSDNGAVVFTLNTPADDTATLDFVRRRMDLGDAVVHLPAGVAGKTRVVHTVSLKEIVLALLQHGRMTELPCRVDALEEEVGIRQNIVAWAETLDWRWPNGGPARWNEKYWRYGTPWRHSLHEAVNDAFLHQRRYGIGCYTATKLAVLQGVLDYYARVAPDPERLRRIEARMSADGEPLVGIEPGAMWYFEDDYTTADGARPGKLVRLQQQVAPDNFVPGDWVYLRNTDAKSRAKTGYEGSNAIYLGRGRFDDYYGEHGHSFSFREKLDEVYQWRHGVFSRSRDAAKIHPLDDRTFLALTQTPATGGLLEGYRGVVANLDAAADAVEISPRAR